jgi:RNA polymerase sigma-70 factor, ECF subfamily
MGGMSSEQGSPDAPGSQNQNEEPSGIDSAERRKQFLREAYREHRSAIYEFAGRVFGPDRSAEVAEEVFLRLWKHPDQFDPSRGSLRPYLLASAHDVAIDFFRRDIARFQRDEPGEQTSNDPESVIESELRALEASARVAEALSSLDPGDRDAIVVAFYGGASYQAIAAATGLPAEAIKSRIRRGLLRMERALRRSGSAMMV